MVESGLLGIVLFEGAQIQYCNAGMPRMLGYPGRDDVCLLDAPRFFAGSSATFVEGGGEAREILTASGLARGQLEEIVLRSLEGEQVFCRFLWDVIPMPEGQGRELTLCLFQDRTELYALADESQKIMIDLEEAKMAQEDQSQTLAELLVQIEQAEKATLEKEKMSGILELAAAMAHEISQPLQAAMNDLNYLIEDKEPVGDDFEALQAVYEGVQEIGAIVDRIRHITTYEAVDYDANIRMVNLSRKASGGDPPESGS